jgi:O-methyltransferase
MIWKTLPPSIRHAVKTTMAPILYKHPPFGLQPERLYVWLDALEQTRDLSGPIIEVGCNMAGTTVIAQKMLTQTGIHKRYICIDTFAGFIEEQFSADQKAGTPKTKFKDFSANSVSLVKTILKQHGVTGVELVQADICTYAGLPDNITACLHDVDLSDPTYQGVKKIYAKLAPGGIICVDDCPEGYVWKAREGYQKFVTEVGLPERYKYGMGMIQKPRAQ